ncbi:MAG: hypothetical protein JSV84_16610 [Gemmatimonadota bacterium]|nr:MAG: hypothetical protein JSV84_16610 [Gemmatimonadota bacterium]
MREVVIQIPTYEIEQNIEIDVSINGKKRAMKYRVEIIEWDNYKEEVQDKVSILRRVIKEHDKDWELIQIGAPSENDIPIMFRKRSAVIEDAW